MPVNMTNTQFNNINLSVARITQANLSNGGITNATPSNVAIQDRQLVGMTINGIPVHEMLADHKAAKG